MGSRTSCSSPGIYRSLSFKAASSKSPIRDHYLSATFSAKCIPLLVGRTSQGGVKLLEDLRAPLQDDAPDLARVYVRKSGARSS